MSATDRADLPAISMANAGNAQYVTLIFRESQTVTGITINLQTSPDLQNWTTVNPPDFSQQVGTDPTTGDPLVEVGVLANGTNRQFIAVERDDAVGETSAKVGLRPESPVRDF